VQRLSARRDFAGVGAALPNPGMQLPPERMREVARAFVASGCRYAVCSGIDSSAWDDAVDIAYMSHVPAPDDGTRFVMTSWHGDEPMRDVAQHFVRNTAFDFLVPKRFLLVGVGASAPVHEALRLVESEGGSSAT